MAQSTILALGQTLATSSDISIPAGITKSVGIFSNDKIPTPVEIFVRMDTPGSDVFVAKLTKYNHTTLLVGPGTYRVVRKNIAQWGVDVGVYVDA